MDGEVLLFDADARIGQALEVALVAGIGGVGDKLAQKDLAVGVDGVDHQIEQFLALGFELTHGHRIRTLFCKIN